MDLANRCAVVSGGGHGIGRALAEELATRGARVVVADLNRERVQKITDRVGGLAVVCDVGSPASVVDLVAQAERTFGPVTVFARAPVSATTWTV